MNKLEMETYKDMLETLIGVTKTTLLLQGLSIVMSIAVAVLLTILGVDLIKSGERVIGIFDLVLAVLNGGVCVYSVTKIKITKQSLKRNLEELARVNSDIENLENEL